MTLLFATRFDAGYPDSTSNTDSRVRTHFGAIGDHPGRHLEKS